MIPVSYNLRSLAVRKTTTVATALGIALVVFVLASALMLFAGIKRTMGGSGRADTAVVLRKGSDTEMTSSIEEPTVGLILAAPGVRHDPGGPPVGVGELVVVVTADKLGSPGVSNLQVRGVPDLALKFHSDLRIVAGRPAQPGTDEAIVGQRVVGRFRGVELGQSFELRKNRPVKIVGVFSDGGSSHESEVWADLDTVRTSFGREALVSSVTVRLEGPEKFDAFLAQIEQDKQLGLLAQRETVYLQRQSQDTAAFMLAMGLIVTVLFSIGAAIGAMITMHASIAGRQREVGTLRALGFSRLSILSSFLLEALLLALFGGAIGAAGAMFMGLVRFSMVNFTTWSEIVFSFTPAPWIILTALGVAGGVGLAGGFLPAVRAARMSPVQAMRE